MVHTVFQLGDPYVELSTCSDGSVDPMTALTSVVFRSTVPLGDAGNTSGGGGG